MRILVTPPATEREWSIASTAVETRIHAYFSPAIVTAWRFYALAVNELLLEAANVDRNTYLENFGSIKFLENRTGPPRWLGALKPAERLLSHPDQLFPVPRNRRSAGDRGYVENIVARYFLVYQRLLGAQQMIAQHLLAANPRGYSVSTHDLIHDLIP